MMNGQQPRRQAEDLRLMRDSKSLTGAVCPTKNMAVSPSGQFVCFRRDNRSLVLLNVESGELTEILIDHIDVCHETDSLFLVAFVDDDCLAVVLQDRDSGKLFLCRARIDQDNKRLDFISFVADSQITARNGYYIDFIRDDGGMVLVSYPHKVTAATPFELLPVSNCMNGDVFANTLSIKIKAQSDGLWCDPFISRNCIYFFDRFEPKLLCVSLSPEHKGANKLLKTYPDFKLGHPNSKFLNKAVLSFDDTVLVYFYHRADKPDAQPQLWYLELSSLQWRRASLSLSHHWPTSRVSFEKTAETIAFIHGECKVSGCAEKAHLYEIDLDESESMIEPPISPISNLNYTFDKVARLKRVVSADTLQQQSPAMRYANRRRQRRPHSLFSVGSTLTSQSSTSSVPSYVHWSQQTERKVSLEPTLLADQLSKAKEMGYTDAQLTAALNLNQKDGQFHSFSSIGAMIDVLDTVVKLDLAEAETTSNRINPPLSPQFANSNALQRLIDVFEKEKRGYEEESQRMVSTLQARITQLEGNSKVLSGKLKDRDKRLADADGRINELSNTVKSLTELQGKYDQLLMMDAEKTAQIQMLRDKVEEQSKILTNLDRLKENDLKLNQKIVQDLRVELAKKQEQLKPIKESLRAMEMESESLRRKYVDQTETARLQEEEIRKLFDQNKHLMKERNKYKDELEKVPTCVVCLEARPEMLFLPCSHFVCCVKCSVNLDKCPNCRAKLTGKCEAYQ